MLLCKNQKAWCNWVHFSLWLEMNSNPHPPHTGQVLFLFLVLNLPTSCYRLGPEALGVEVPDVDEESSLSLLGGPFPDIPFPRAAPW